MPILTAPALVSRRGAILGSCAASLAFGRARAQAPAQSDPWPALRAQIFEDRPVQEDTGLVALDAPYRAEDAAIVPITLRPLLAPDDKRQVRRLTLVIDENPSPLAAAFELGKDNSVTHISTRVRVDSYTNMHAVAELSDGSLHGVTRFVKAAGGCSAPALKQEANAIPLGTMRFRRLMPEAVREDGTKSEVQLMIRHPNYSGLQMDQVTRLYIPADFVQHVQFSRENDPVLSIESGISISENPQFRIGLRDDASGTWRAEVSDINDRSFRGAWQETAGL